MSQFFILILLMHTGRLHRPFFLRLVLIFDKHYKFKINENLSTKLLNISYIRIKKIFLLFGKLLSKFHDIITVSVIFKRSQKDK